MWMQDLGLIFEDINDYRNSSVGVSRPNPAGPKLSYSATKFGMAEPTESAASGAGMARFGNPQEQEEDVMISKNKILKLLDAEMSKLDSSSPTDRIAIGALGQIKNKLK
jgi:hypothetical protein